MKLYWSIFLQYKVVINFHFFILISVAETMQLGFQVEVAKACPTFESNVQHSLPLHTATVLHVPQSCPKIHSIHLSCPSCSLLEHLHSTPFCPGKDLALLVWYEVPAGCSCVMGLLKSSLKVSGCFLGFGLFIQKEGVGLQRWMVASWKNTLNYSVTYLCSQSNFA